MSETPPKQPDDDAAPKDDESPSPEPQPEASADGEPAAVTDAAGDKPAADPKSASQAKPEEYSLGRFLKKALIFTITMIVLVYGVLWGFAFALQDSAMFPIDELTQVAPGSSLPPQVTVTIEIENGEKVEAMLVPGYNRTAENPGPLVVYFHGNMELIDEQKTMMVNYLNLGVSVLLPEYRGYGRSGGKPSQENIRRDALRFIEIAKEQPFVDPNAIVYHGRSLGGAVATDLATQAPPAGLILESTFTSTSDMVPELRAPNFLFRNPFRTLDTLESIDIPVLVMHGVQDEVVPYSHAERLAAAGPHVKLVSFPEATHNNFPGTNGAIRDYWLNIIGFMVENHLMQPPAPEGALRATRAHSPAPTTQPTTETVPEGESAMAPRPVTIEGNAPDAALPPVVAPEPEMSEPDPPMQSPGESEATGEVKPVPTPAPDASIAPEQPDAPDADADADADAVKNAPAVPDARLPGDAEADEPADDAAPVDEGNDAVLAP